MSPVRKPGGKTGKLRSAARSLAQKVGRKGHDETPPPVLRTVEAAGNTREAGGKTTAPSKKPEPLKRKATTKATGAKAATPKKAVAAKTPARKTAAGKSPAKSSTAKKATATKPAVKKPAVKKPAPTRKTTQPSKRTAKAPARRGRPAKFDAKALAQIRAQLVTEKGDLERQQAEMEEDSFVGTQSEITGEVGLDEDFADAGTATFDRERDLSIQHNIHDLIDQITRAIDRIDEKAYGICERCGEPIDAARLKALPHAGLCLDCKRREERTR